MNANTGRSVVQLGEQVECARSAPRLTFREWLRQCKALSSARPHAGTAISAHLAAVATACALLVAGCATSSVDAQWVDPQFTGRSLGGARVFVVCQANDLAVRRICADQMAAQLAELGAMPVLAPDDTDSGNATQPSTERYISAARAAGAVAILRTTISPDLTVVGAGPSFGVGLGGFGGSRHSGGGFGVGVSVPIGNGGSPATGYSANGALTDVTSGRLMWTAKATTPPSPDVSQQLATLAKTVLEAARKAGLF